VAGPNLDQGESAMTMPTPCWRAARRAALASALALAGVAAGQGTAAAQAAPHPIPISSCYYTIMASGTYVLTQDLTCPGSEPAITVAPNVDNVRLVLAGRTLTGDGDDEGNGVVAVGTLEDPIAGLRVVGGTVTGFDDGVFIRNAPGARVAGVTAAGNQRRGIYVDQSPGAWLVGNTARDNREGIYAEDCDGCQIVGNRAIGNAREIFSDGIQLDSTAGARVVGNTATDNGDDGFDISFGSADNLVSGNVVTGNLGSGIDVVDGSRGNQFVGNLATGNDADPNGDRDLFDGNVRSDEPTVCPNTWRANRFATDNEVGAGAGPGAGCIR